MSDAKPNYGLTSRHPNSWAVASVILLPTLYFFLIFHPALIGKKIYGNRTNQEKLATDLDRYSANLSPTAPLFAQYPEMLHPDYHLLYEPSNQEIQKAYRNGRLPLYNPHRLLGTALWGSPVADPANPLSLLLLWFSTDTVHLIKLYLYTLIAFAGVYWCGISILDAQHVPALTGATIYILNPFMYYMYHWAGLCRVMALVPAIFCVVHLFLMRPRFLYLALLEVLVAWVLVINQLQALLYFILFLLLWMVLALTLRVYKLRAIKRRFCLLLLTGAGGCALSWGYTRYLFERGLALARQTHSQADLGKHLVSVRPLVSMWLDAGVLKQGRWEASLLYFPVTVMGVLVAAAILKGHWTNRCRVALAVAFGVVSFHCFVRPLHDPLYWIHLPLYTLNFEQWRVVYLFYFCIALTVAVAMTTLLERGAAKLPVDRPRRILGASLFWGAAAACASLGVLLVLHGRRGFLLIAAFFGFLILGLGFRRHFSSGHAILLSLSIASACLYLPMTRVPFYDRAEQTDAAVTSASPTLDPRVIRLLDLSKMSSFSWELLWYNDASFAMSRRDGLTGYDTALQRNEARLFSVFYSPSLQDTRQSNPYLKYGVRSSIVWPDAQGILDDRNQLSAVNEARLRVLGVGDILWKNRIPGIRQARWDARFLAWDQELTASSAISLLPETEPQEVAALFSNRASENAARRIVRGLQSASVRVDDSSGNYQATLPAQSGLVIIAFNIGKFYRAYLDGIAIPFLDGTDLPVLLVRKSNSHPAVLELRPETGPVWRTAVAGIAVGLFLLLSIWKLGRFDGGHE
jgi:hypothetical protein